MHTRNLGNACFGGLVAALILSGSATAQCPSADPLEDNDDCASAVSISTGNTSGLTCFGDFNGRRDDDWYSISLPDGKMISVDCLFTHASGDIDMRLRDATGGCDGTIVDSGVSTTDDEHVSWTNTSGAAVSIVIEVYGVGSMDCNAYGLDIGVLCPTDDTYEDNEDCGTAAPVFPGVYAGLWGAETDSDHYSIHVADGGAIDVDIFFSDAVADLDLYLWDAAVAPCGTPNVAGFLDRSWTVTDDEAVSWTNATGVGVLVVIETRMFNPGTNDCAPYTMDVTITPPPLGTVFCAADTSAIICPCANNPAPASGEGCRNTTGVGAYLTASGAPSVSADTLSLCVNQSTPLEFGIFIQNVVSSPYLPFYNGLLCLPIDTHLVRHYDPPAILPTITDAAGYGCNAQPLTIGDFLGDTVPGQTIFYQFWYRDAPGFGATCTTGANFSSGLAILWFP